MKLFAQVLAAAFVAATVLPLSRLSDWWVRAFDFPRPQIAALGVGLLIAYVWAWDVHNRFEGALLALLAICVLYQVARMLPYTPLYPRQVVAAADGDPRNTLAILVSNVYMENREAARLLRLIRSRSPDLVLTVETDDWWEEQLRALEEDYPHTVKHPLDNTYGMLLYSRLELIEPRVELLLADDIPSVHADVRLPSGRTFRFYGLHPRPPAPTEAPDTVERDGELLIVARRVSEHGGPTIVAGDLNDVAWSATTSLMQRVGGLLDPRIGRGLYSTYNAKIPVLRWPLDHVFHSEHFQLVSLERLPPVGSDHFPIFVRLALSPLAPLRQDAPEPEPGDGALAGEMIEEALGRAE
jgi:endonuclease/exonuclease/phosphatase (EEP) superfamily protein YafD